MQDSVYGVKWINDCRDGVKMYSTDLAALIAWRDSDISFDSPLVVRCAVDQQIINFKERVAVWEKHLEKALLEVANNG